MLSSADIGSIHIQPHERVENARPDQAWLGLAQFIFSLISYSTDYLITDY